MVVAVAEQAESASGSPLLILHRKQEERRPARVVDPLRLLRRRLLVLLVLLDVRESALLIGWEWLFPIGLDNRPD